MSIDMNAPIDTHKYTVRPARSGVPDTTWYVLRDAAGPLPLPRTMAVCDRESDARDVAAGLALLEAARTGTAAADVTGAPV